MTFLFPLPFADGRVCTIQPGNENIYSFLTAVVGKCHLCLQMACEVIISTDKSEVGQYVSSACNSRGCYIPTITVLRLQPFLRNAFSTILLKVYLRVRVKCAVCTSFTRRVE